MNLISWAMHLIQLLTTTFAVLQIKIFNFHNLLALKMFQLNETVD